jgi:hypothetical protein
MVPPCCGTGWYNAALPEARYGRFCYPLRATLFIPFPCFKDIVDAKINLPTGHTASRHDLLSIHKIQNVSYVPYNRFVNILLPYFPRDLMRYCP